jgi:propanol-preferring alcohol dehydrogenase
LKREKNQTDFFRAKYVPSCEHNHLDRQDKFAMKAMLLQKTGLLSDNPMPLVVADLPTPTPGPNQVLIEVSVCGVCHTELDEIEGRTPPPRLPIVPGHQVVGVITEIGKNVSKLNIGDRVGVGWIFRSDGCETENLSPDFQATGRDANGGYAEFMTVDEDYAYPIPTIFADEQAAPLLCAGSIGYRALRLTKLQDSQPLGLTGFGGSAHIVIQLARHLYPNSPVFVFARDEQERNFARELGAVWAGDTSADCPSKLQAIIDTTPAWTPVVAALKNLKPGGRLVINAIRKQEADKRILMELDYERHLWMEREIKTVANITRRDIAEFLNIAAKIPITPEVQSYPLEEANTALVELQRGSIRGAKVLRIGRL